MEEAFFITTASFLTMHSEPPGTATQLAISIAIDHPKRTRQETIEENRQNQQLLALARVIPARVQCKPEQYAGVRCEWVVHRSKKKQPRTILYLHGGSWIYGGMNTARPVGVLLTDVTGYRCLMVDYRLAPEHPYPAGLDDCFAVYQYLLAQGVKPGNIGIFGDSAGGNLALALMHRLQQGGISMPACVALASPVTDMRPESFLVSSQDDLIFTQLHGQETDIFSTYLGNISPDQRGIPTISPIVGDLSGFPPMLMHTGADETIAPDNIAFCEEAYRQGCNIRLGLWEYMFHDFTIVGRTLRESMLSMKEMGAFFQTYMK